MAFQFFRSIKAVGYAVLLWRLINACDAAIVALMDRFLSIQEGSIWMVLIMMVVAFAIMKSLNVNMGHWLGEEMDTEEDDEEMRTYVAVAKAVQHRHVEPSTTEANATSRSAPSTPRGSREGHHSHDIVIDVPQQP